MSKTNLVQKNRRRKRRGLKRLKAERRGSMVAVAMKAITNCRTTPTLLAHCPESDDQCPMTNDQ